MLQDFNACGRLYQGWFESKAPEVKTSGISDSHHAGLEGAHKIWRLAQRGRGRGGNLQLQPGRARHNTMCGNQGAAGANVERSSEILEFLPLVIHATNENRNG